MTKFKIRIHTNFLLKFVVLALVVAHSGCASKPLIEKDDVKVTRDEPSTNCKSLGFIEGRVITIHGTQEQAIENLKEEAVKKGANWVRTESMGAQGGVIRGQAFQCP